MSIGVLVQQVQHALQRAEELFGDPPEPTNAATTAGTALHNAADLIRSANTTLHTNNSGQLATAYHHFNTHAAPALDTAAGSDNTLSSHLSTATDTDRTGKTDSASVRNGTTEDTAALRPFTGTHTGQRALIAALRTRIAQQQHLINTYRQRDAHLAALARTTTYHSAPPHPIPLADMTFCGSPEIVEGFLCRFRLGRGFPDLVVDGR